MWTPTLPLWEITVRAAVVYAALLLLIRLSGRRTVGQFTPFDLLVVMLLSESVSDALSGGENSVAGGVISAAVLVALNSTLAVISARSKKMHQLLEGEAVLVGKDGELYHQVLKKERVPESDVHQALREADCPLDCMHCAFLEADGRISILRKR